MDTSIPTDTRIVGTHEGMGRARVSYLSNRVGTSIILSVPMGTIDIPIAKRQERKKKYMDQLECTTKEDDKFIV